MWRHNCHSDTIIYVHYLNSYKCHETRGFSGSVHLFLILCLQTKLMGHSYAANSQEKMPHSWNPKKRISVFTKVSQFVPIMRHNRAVHRYFFLFPFGVLQLVLPKAPQPYGLLYYPPCYTSNFIHQFRATTPPK